jgi:hypothetical protein
MALHALPSPPLPTHHDAILHHCSRKLADQEGKSRWLGAKNGGPGEQQAQ